MTIQIENLQKKYGSTIAVSDVDLHVPEGEMLVLLGPSGCGKTTTMRCIAGLETPNSGTISIGDRVVFSASSNMNIPVNRRNVGMVFQSYAIWPHMTVFENVGFPLKMAKLPTAEARRRTTEALEVVGLGEFADRGASYLSGGQMQRVALARSLAMKPAILLFDEPLSNLDARLRDHLRVQLRELQTQFKITSVYVTHDQREALALADKIMVMDHGHVLQIDDPISLYNNPNSRTVAAFLGYSNIFDARIDGHGTDGGGVNVRIDQTGDQIAALHAPQGARSAQVACCVRPEDIEITPDAPAPGADTVVDGQVILASFMGTQMQYRVRTQAGLVWEVLSGTIARNIHLGDRVHLRFPRENVKLLPIT